MATISSEQLTAERVAKELKAWRGHILAPATRKGDREKTFEAIVLHVLDAATDYDTAMRNDIIARFFPGHWKIGQTD